MYTSTTMHTDQPIEAWRIGSDPGSIWFGVSGGSGSRSSLTFAEAQRLVTELQRELAAVEAAARAVAP